MSTRHTYTYTVTRRSTGEVAASGSSEDCAAALGIAVHSFTTMAHRSYQGKTRYRIVRQYHDAGSQLEEAAAAWDRFCAPIREKYGVRIRRHENG